MDTVKKYTVLESQDGHTTVVGNYDTLQEVAEVMREYAEVGVVARCRLNTLGRAPFVGNTQQAKPRTAFMTALYRK